MKKAEDGMGISGLRVGTVDELSKLSFHDVPALVVSKVAEANQGLAGLVHDPEYSICRNRAHRAGRRN